MFRKILLFVILSMISGVACAEDPVGAEAAPILTDIEMASPAVFTAEPASPDEALRFYEELAAKGSMAAQMNLAFMLAEGTQVPQDLAEAFSWFLRAARQGNSLARLNVAIMYAEGLGVAANAAEASLWYLRAAEGGNARAQYEFGRLKAAETGAEAEEAALAWYRKSAGQGYAPAMNAIGMFYFEGRGRLRKDVRQAMEWCLKAAEAGCADGAYSMGLIYKARLDDRKDMSGRDLVAAMKWLDIAAVMWGLDGKAGMEGSSKVEVVRKQVGAYMAASEVAEAQKQADAWMAARKFSRIF